MLPGHNQRLRPGRKKFQNMGRTGRWVPVWARQPAKNYFYRPVLRCGLWEFLFLLAIKHLNHRRFIAKSEDVSHTQGGAHHDFRVNFHIIRILLKYPMNFNSDYRLINDFVKVNDFEENFFSLVLEDFGESPVLTAKPSAPRLLLHLRQSSLTLYLLYHREFWQEFEVYWVRTAQRHQ